MLNLVHETFDQMALTITPVIVVAWELTISFGWNNRGGLMIGNKLDKFISIIALISQHIGTSVAVNQGNSLGDVVPFAACQTQTKRIAQAINTHMDFRA